MVASIYDSTASPGGQIREQQRDLRRAAVSVANDLHSENRSDSSSRRAQAVLRLARRIDQCERTGALPKDIAQRLRCLQKSLASSMEESENIPADDVQDSSS